MEKHEVSLLAWLAILSFVFMWFLYLLVKYGIDDHKYQQARANARDSIAAEIRRYKLDSIRLELAIIEADMRNESLRDSIRLKLKATKP